MIIENATSGAGASATEIIDMPIVSNDGDVLFFNDSPATTSFSDGLITVLYSYNTGSGTTIGESSIVVGFFDDDGLSKKMTDLKKLITPSPQALYGSISPNYTYTIGLITEPFYNTISNIDSLSIDSKTSGEFGGESEGNKYYQLNADLEGGGYGFLISGNEITLGSISESYDVQARFYNYIKIVQ